MSVDERVGRPRRKRKMGIRQAVLSLYELPKAGYQLGAVGRKIKEWGSVCWYSSKFPGTKRKTTVDVDEMVTKWKEAIVAMTLAHDKATVDAWEFKLNELLTPFLSAPVAQIREFYRKLTLALHDDASVPWFIWKMFASWGKEMVDGAPDEQVIKLKTELAGRIARMVEPDVQPQLAEAITNALCWRDPKTLAKVERSLKKGAKAKMTGRESCLFLEVDDVLVML